MCYFGDRLHQLRQSRKLTLNEMAKLTGVSRNTLSEWESGKKQPYYMDAIYDLAKKFEVSPQYFFESEDKKFQDIINEFSLRLNKIERRQAMTAKHLSMLADTLKEFD